MDFVTMKVYTSSNLTKSLHQHDDLTQPIDFGISEMYFCKKMP